MGPRSEQLAFHGFGGDTRSAGTSWELGCLPGQWAERRCPGSVFRRGAGTAPGGATAAGEFARSAGEGGASFDSPGWGEGVDGVGAGAVCGGNSLPPLREGSQGTVVADWSACHCLRLVPAAEPLTTHRRETQAGQTFGEDRTSPGASGLAGASCFGLGVAAAFAATAVGMVGARSAEAGKTLPPAEVGTPFDGSCGAVPGCDPCAAGATTAAAARVSVCPCGVVTVTTFVVLLMMTVLYLLL